MIVDLFSHKIHSSSNEWPEKLAELAAIFGEFDGHLFDRSAFEERLQRISPRASYLASEAAGQPLTPGGRLDVSKFRDEISAYPAYLGLYFLEKSPRGWVVRVSETAKQFLLCEEPDVASFLRLQLPLFQYPNAMGASYTSFSNRLRIQANARDRTLDFISKGIHFSPLRLIATAIKADATLRGVNILDARISYREVFGLANTDVVSRYALPPEDQVSLTLHGIRNGSVPVPEHFESRFHTLKHTQMFRLDRGCIQLREAISPEDKEQLLNQLDAICNIDNQFNGFDSCTSGQDLESVIGSGYWGRYFDGVRILPSSIVKALTSDKALEAIPRHELIAEAEATALPVIVAETYPFRDHSISPSPVRPYDRRTELADPEVTRIKLQRRNLIHKELIHKMASYLRTIGASPKENDHVDLYAKIPTDGSFIFEMKSGGHNLLEQIRKGLSQLYEYRYRYKDIINDEHISLCLVLAESPDSIPWVADYLCNDRDINICWFDDDGNPVWPSPCAERMRVLEF